MNKEVEFFDVKRLKKKFPVVAQTRRGRYLRQLWSFRHSFGESFFIQSRWARTRDLLPDLV